MPKNSEHADDSGFLPLMERFFQRHLLLVNVVVHTLVFGVALLLAYLVRFDITKADTQWFRPFFLRFLPFFIIVKLLVFGKLKLFRGGWQYSGIRDVANILLACWLSLLIMFVTVYLCQQLPVFALRRIPYASDYFSGYSNGILVLDFLATVFLACAVRMGYRLYREELRPISAEGLTRVLMVGAGNAAESIIREINRMHVERYRVVGLVDDDKAKIGIIIHGVPVLGATADMPAICAEQNIDEIIIAMPSATQKELRRIVDICRGTKLKFQSLPGVGDLINGKVAVSQIRPVDINDLLGRAAIQLDCQAIARFIEGRRVLVTGAGGSIGSEMCRQIAAFKPAKLILVEQAENPMFDIEGELKTRFPAIPLVPCICDVHDRQRVMNVWQMHQPQVVVHAAAHKHVPLMERNPCEAVKNNILGTRNVADASCAHGTAEFVMISTDKAVNPSSVMGASKRVAEIYTQSLNGRPGCKTKFKAVRFGNVLGSSGSVIPTFRKQIAAGGPITVTHPDMTRYFMTIPEASQLVLQAAATGDGGQIFLLDMGEPVRIVDLALQMITLSGFRPGEDIDIVFTGTRPGEKLFEELRTEGEDIEPTVHPKVNVWKCRPADWATVQHVYGELEALYNSMDRQKIIQTIQKLVPEYTPLNPPTDAPAAAATPA